jgi:allophanate hydrolase
VPAKAQLQFFGNTESAQLFENAVQQLISIGATIQEIDFSSFVKAAKLLYEGPWVAERYHAVGGFIEGNPNDVLPVIKTVIGAGNQSSAVDAFDAQYKLRALQQLADQQLAIVDAVVTPTIGTIYTLAEIEQDPIQLNSNLGYYTNFMNLLDCSAVTVPSGFYMNGVGFGVTLFHHAFADKKLLSIAQKFQQHTKINIGATKMPVTQHEISTRPPKNFVDVVVCGAHLEGLPLNWQLHERGATLLQRTQSSSNYKLYALAGGPPFRPGMIRDANSGVAIEVEVWRVPAENFGSFVAEIPVPLGIGKVELADGRWESGFICEASGLSGATDITIHGSWKKYLSSLSPN